MGGSLIAKAAAVALSPFVDDDAPTVPSVPVQIGHSNVRPGRAEIGSWQALILMFTMTIVIGTAVLMYVVWRRGKVLERRRVRRTAEVAAATLAQATPATLTAAGATPAAPTQATRLASPHAATRPPGPERVT